MASPCGVGLSQAELDALGHECQEDDAECPSSPDKRRRRITLSAMDSEITAIRQSPIEPELAEVRRRSLGLTTDPCQGGLQQADLDELQVGEEMHASARDNSPVSSALRLLKRRRDSSGAGVAAMTVRAIELATEASPVADVGGLSQAELDEMSNGNHRCRSESPETGCASEALSARRRRAFGHQAEDTLASPAKACRSPPRRRRGIAKPDAENMGTVKEVESIKTKAADDTAFSFAAVPPFPKSTEAESPARRVPRSRPNPLSPVNSCVC